MSLLSAHLVGLRVWDAGRAVEMRKLGLGPKTASPEHRGRNVGLWELHLQGTWAVTRGGRMIVGEADVYVPTSSEVSWDERGGNLGDRLCSEHFANDLVVEACEVGPVGSLHLLFSDGSELNAVARASNGELWRVFAPGRKHEGQFVAELLDGVFRLTAP